MRNTRISQRLRQSSGAAFKSKHVDYYKQRKLWFEDWPGARAVLWWWGGGRPPSLADAYDRWRWLRHRGPTAEDFTIKTAAKFPKP